MLCQVWQIEALCVFALLRHDFTHSDLIFRLHNELPEAPNISPSLHYLNQLANVLDCTMSCLRLSISLSLHYLLMSSRHYALHYKDSLTASFGLFVCYAEHVIELNKHLGVNLRDTRRMQGMWGRAQ